MLVRAPALVNLSVAPVERPPSVKTKFKAPAPVLFKVKVVALPLLVSKDGDWDNRTLESLMVKESKVLAPLKVWVVLKSARVIVPVGKLATVVPVVFKVRELLPVVAKVEVSARSKEAEAAETTVTPL